MSKVVTYENDCKHRSPRLYHIRSWTSCYIGKHILYHQQRFFNALAAKERTSKCNRSNSVNKTEYIYDHIVFQKGFFKILFF